MVFFLSFFLCLFLVFARSLLLLRGVIVVVVVVVRVVTHHNRRRRLPAAHASFQRRVGRHRCRDGVEFGGGERVVGTQEYIARIRVGVEFTHHSGEIAGVLARDAGGGDGALARTRSRAEHE